VSAQLETVGGVAVGLAQVSVPASHAFDGVQAAPATQAVQVPATQTPLATVLHAVASATGTPVSTQLGGTGGIAVGSPQLRLPRSQGFAGTHDSPG
jgi:hypothetical protein